MDTQIAKLGCGNGTGAPGQRTPTSTLQKHCRTWQRMSLWLEHTFQVPWPNGAQLAAYLQARAAEPCGKSVPVSCEKTILFIEAAGEAGQDAKVSCSPARWKS